MKITGIVAEYNPFHYGHLEHLKQARHLSDCDYLIAIMSGNFVQRGQPALINKWERAEIAVKCGVDLLIELPTFYAVASAESFAMAAVYLLTKLGVDTIAFGAETADLVLLQKIANNLLSDTHQLALKRELNRGLAYHKAVEQALGELNFSFSPNNILALEYLKAIKKLNSSLTPLVIQRKGDAYLSEEIHSNIASATAIRKQVLQPTVDWHLLKNILPPLVYEKLYNYPHYASINEYKYIFNALAIGMGREGIAKIRGVGEGLENRIYQNLSNVNSLDDFIAEVSSKRYPKTRISRIIVNTLLNIQQENKIELSMLDYARVLAYREESRLLLRHLKKESQLFMLSNLARDLKKYRKPNPLIDLDIKATGIYACIDPSVELKADYFRHPFKLDKQINNSTTESR